MKKKWTPRFIWQVLWEAGKKWWDKDPVRESSTLAYCAIFSIPALLAIVFAIVSFVFGRDAVNGQLSAQIGQAMNPQTAAQIEDMIAKSAISNKSVLATIIGFVTLVSGATGVLTELQKSLNNIWEVKVDPGKKRWWYTLRTRLFSFGLIVSLGFLMMVSMSATVLLSAFSSWIEARYPGVVTWLMGSLNFIISLGVLSLLFAMVFKVLPDATVRWRHCFTGGVVTALLFLLGKFALGIYFAKAQPASVYGAAGSVILILIWVSYSSMIVFYGAEFTHALVLRSGSRVHPAENAVKVPGLNKEIIRTNTNEKRATG